MPDLEKCIAEIEFRFPCVKDHEFTRKEWQTLKKAILTQQSNNTGSPKCAHCSQGTVVINCAIGAEPESPYCHKHRTLRVVEETQTITQQTNVVED